MVSSSGGRCRYYLFSSVCWAEAKSPTERGSKKDRQEDKDSFRYTEIGLQFRSIPTNNNLSWSICISHEPWVCAIPARSTQRASDSIVFSLPPPTSSLASPASPYLFALFRRIRSYSSLLQSATSSCLASQPLLP